MKIDDKTAAMITVEPDRFTTIKYALFLMLGNILPPEISTFK
jgi:hypothetical protein